MLIHFCSPAFVNIIEQHKRIFSTLFAEIIQPLKYMAAVFLLTDKFEFFSEFIIPKFTTIFNVQIWTQPTTSPTSDSTACATAKPRVAFWEAMEPKWEAFEANCVCWWKRHTTRVGNKAHPRNPQEKKPTEISFLVYQALVSLGTKALFYLFTSLLGEVWIGK